MGGEYFPPRCEPSAYWWDPQENLEQVRPQNRVLLMRSLNILLLRIYGGVGSPLFYLVANVLRMDADCGRPFIFFFGICSTKGDSLTIHSTMGDFAGHLLGLTSPIPSPPSTLSPLLCPFSPSWKGGWKNLEFFFGFSAFCLLKSEPWNQSHLEFEINVGRFLLVCCLKRFFVEKTLSFFLGFHFCLLNQNHEIRNIPQLQLTCTRSNSPDIKNHFWKSLFSLKFLLLSFIARSFDFVLGPRISRSNEDVCGWKSSEQFRACLVFLVSLENFTYILEQVWNFEKLSRATQMFFFDLQNMCSILELELIWIVY